MTSTELLYSDPLAAATAAAAASAAPAQALAKRRADDRATRPPATRLFWRFREHATSDSKLFGGQKLRRQT